MVEFIGGCFVGSLVTVFTMAVCTAGKDDRDG